MLVYKFLLINIVCFDSRAVMTFKQAMGRWQKLDFKTIKIHAMSHFSNCIRRSGLSWEYSTNQYEQLHITLMKKGYRASNKRNATSQILKHNYRLNALRKLSMNKDEYEKKTKAQKYTALDEVNASTSLHLMN
jgi:hypothetical protein